MRSRMLRTLLVLGTVAAAAVYVLPAGAAPDASKAKTKKLATAKVPLPDPGQAGVTAVTLKVTAPKGKSVGALSVKATNADDVAAADADAVAALPPKSHKQSAKLTIYVAMFRGNLANDPRKSTDSMLMPILGPAFDSANPTGRVHVSPVECAELATSPHGNLLQDIAKEDYKALVQISEKPAEEQWDQDIYADCSDQGAEQPDTGDE